MTFLLGRLRVSVYIYNHNLVVPRGLTVSKRKGLSRKLSDTFWLVKEASYVESVLSDNHLFFLFFISVWQISYAYRRFTWQCQTDSLKKATINNFKLHF